MKCTNCGFPLSPARTGEHCPRCGYSEVKVQQTSDQISALTPVPGSSFNGPQGNQVLQSNMSISQVAQKDTWGQPLPGTQQPPAALIGESLSQGNWMPSTPSNTQPPTPYSPSWPASIPIQQSLLANWPHLEADNMRGPYTQTPAPQQEYMSQPTRKLMEPVTFNKPGTRFSNIGFMVSGLCLIGGALILIFVYFMAMGLTTNTPGGNPGIANTTPPTSSPSPSLATSTPTLLSTPTASATTSLPGQAFINKAQTASAVDINTAKVLQSSTTFKVSQRIYVSFHLHPAGQSGAACLLWYLNGQNTSHFEFSVYPNSKIAYSYTIFTQPGAGYVDIYWASSTACTDKLLAQHVVFTVTT